MPGSTTPAIALLVAGGVLFEAARSKRSIVDTLLAREAPAPTINPTVSAVVTNAQTKASGAVSSVTAAVQKGQAVVAKAGTAVWHNPDGESNPVALWMIPQLKWCRKHGWDGNIASGYRTPAEQIAAATNYGLQHYPNGPLASNHVRTIYPGGAIDVKNPAQLAAVLRKCPIRPRLVWGGPVMGDQPHFSANGH